MKRTLAIEKEIIDSIYMVTICLREDNVSADLLFTFVFKEYPTIPSIMKAFALDSFVPFMDNYNDIRIRTEEYLNIWGIPTLPKGDSGVTKIVTNWVANVVYNDPKAVQARLDACFGFISVSERKLM